MQTTYSEKMAAAVAGQMVDCTNRRIESKYAEAAIDAGTAVEIGTTDNQVKPAAASAYGVAIQHPTLAIEECGTNGAQYAEKSGVSVLTNGRVWVQVNEAVAIDDDAYYVVATKNFGKTVGTNIAIAGGKFKSSTTGAGLAILEIK